MNKESKVEIIAQSSHRNGVCGDPFNVALFRDGEDGTIKLAVDFGGMAFAVLQVDKLAAGDIAFGSNSWRGDRYAEKVRAACNGMAPESTPDALCVAWPLKG
jgi:hypothetical protein